MNRIRDATFILISALAAVFVLGGYFLLEDKNRLIEATQKELKGVAVQRELYNLMLALENVRGSSAPAAKGNGYFIELLEKNMAIINETRQAINTMEGSSLLPPLRWSSFQKSEPQTFEERTQQIKDLKTIMRDVGDNSTLILDPEMASYYLGDITVNLIPEITEEIAITRGSITKALINRNSIELDVIQSRLMQLATMHDNLSRASNIVQNTKTLDAIYGPNNADFEAANAFYRELMQAVIRDPMRFTGQEFFERSTQVINAYAAAFDSSTDLLALHLKKRIKENKDGRVFTIFYLFFIYCFVVSIGYMALNNYVQKQEVLAARETAHILEKLEKTNNELEHFAYVASHDLKEPLRTIASFAKLLQQKYGLVFDETGKEYLNILMAASTRMQQMISALLDYARIDYEASKPEVFDCTTELKRVLENLQQPIEQSAVTITADNLPSITHHAGQFARLMQNLISNAIKYRREDIASRIHIGCEDVGYAWQFSVQDNGIGVDPAYFNKIFEPFKRLHTQQQFEGTGIGLAMCKKTVERMGGKLWLTSKPNEGSIFYFTLLKPK
ncbi:MAG: ATP-binding protein [Alphaproteobacteria bacterium]|nr:ATP-binding protein [Alphaproteobacteria bacterium]